MSLQKARSFFVILLSLLTVLPFSAQAAITPLPLDFSGGMPLQMDRFSGDTSYEDPSITVNIETGRDDGCDWWAARIKIADPSQLRTISAGGFDSNMVTSGAVMAKRVNAVLAIDGDYFSYTTEGFIVRQGILYRNKPGNADILLIDEEGNFHIVLKGQENDSAGDMEDHSVINAFTFGPALVVNGKRVTNYVQVNGMAAELGRQRMCIAQVGELEYMCICCAGPARGSCGMTLDRFSILVESFGVQNAYNLDGGNSAMMIFHHDKINDIRNLETRDISDIIYFASAYTPDEAE